MSFTCDFSVLQDDFCQLLSDRSSSWQLVLVSLWLFSEITHLILQLPTVRGNLPSVSACDESTHYQLVIAKTLQSGSKRSLYWYKRFQHFSLILHQWHFKTTDERAKRILTTSSCVHFSTLMPLTCREKSRFQQKSHLDIMLKIKLKTYSGHIKKYIFLHSDINFIKNNNI